MSGKHYLIEKYQFGEVVNGEAPLYASKECDRYAVSVVERRTRRTFWVRREVVEESEELLSDGLSLDELTTTLAEHIGTTPAYVLRYGLPYNDAKTFPEGRRFVSQTMMVTQEDQQKIQRGLERKLYAAGRKAQAVAMQKAAAVAQAPAVDAPVGRSRGKLSTFFDV